MLSRKDDSAATGELAEAADAPGRSGERYERRRADIVAAAIPVLNSQGFKGMRLTAVAELIGLRATGVTYYFSRKEELAVACFESALEVFHGLLCIAETERDARSRVGRLISEFVARDAAVRRGDVTPLASFGPMHALEGAHYERVMENYRAMFRRVRALLDAPELAGLSKIDRSTRTLVLLEQLYWANAWMRDFDVDDYPRIATRLTDIICNGFAPKGRRFAPERVELLADDTRGDAAKDSYLRAATREINAHGYRGASVDRIAASMNVTKGAFYHHNDAKDDLMVACFRRTFEIIREAQRRVRGQGSDEWLRLTSAVTSLIDFQFSGDGPLLRTAVLSSMPHEHQVEVVSLSYKVSRQFAAMIADAISEGAARPVDPTLAAHLLGAAINAASDVRLWRSGPEGRDALAYARPLFEGLLNP